MIEKEKIMARLWLKVPNILCSKHIQGNKLFISWEFTAQQSWCIQSQSLLPILLERGGVNLNNNNNNSNNNSNDSNENTNNNNSNRNTSEKYGSKSTLLSKTPRYNDVPLAEKFMINKLSFRRKIPPTPAAHVIRQREANFVLDSITTEKRRTKYKDVIPRYDAVKDAHAKAYFKRGEVQKLINVTCTLKPVSYLFVLSQ